VKPCCNWQKWFRSATRLAGPNWLIFIMEVQTPLFVNMGMFAKGTYPNRPAGFRKDGERENG
jgi:hypothetical protein